MFKTDVKGSKLVRVSRLGYAAALQLGMCLLVTGQVAAQRLDGPEQRVLIRWKRDVNASQATAANALANARARFGMGMTTLRRMVMGSDVVRLERRMSAAELKTLMATLRQDPAVESVEEDLLLQPMFTPNDPQYSSQWHYYEPTGGLNLPAAWDLSTGSGISVAVIDTGYSSHADLGVNVRTGLFNGFDFITDPFIANDGGGRDTDPFDTGDARSAGQCPAPYQLASSSSWHGTHVAGTIVAMGNNGAGVTGVAFNARVIPIRALGRCGAQASDVIEAIAWAAGIPVNGVPANPYPAKVINLSLGIEAPCPAAGQAVIDAARARGAVIVVAAGNDNKNAASFTPANCAGVITVAATTRTGDKAYYSNTGTNVDVAAPGGDMRASIANGVLSTFNAGASGPGGAAYGWKEGTSMAAAHVSGVAALMMSRNSQLQPDEVESGLKTTRRTFPGSCSLCGTGIVDAFAAVKRAAPLVPGVAVTGLSAPIGTEMHFTMTVPAGATVQFAATGAAGDSDLYVRAGAVPNVTTFDCRPYFGAIDELCTFTAAVTTTYHVMIRAYGAFSGLSLRGSY